MGEEYKISLGVDISVDDIQSQINIAENKVKPIKLNVEIENLDEIKKQIQNLGGIKGNKKVAIPIDTASVENALHEVSTAIKEIRTSMGTLDSKSGMKSLLSSINQISNALDKASDKFTELNANLNALSGKDLNFNFGINLGGSNSFDRNTNYGIKARNDTLPQLKKQAEALQDYLKQYYKVNDEYNAILKLTRSSGNYKIGGEVQDLYTVMSGYQVKGNKPASLTDQMDAYKRYIGIIKEYAALNNIDLSHITSGFSKSADQLVQDANDVRTGAKEMDESFEKLKQIFGGGGGLNVEGLSASLEPIIADLREIKEVLRGLSSGVSIEGLTQSFDRLSDTIEKLVQNATQVKNVLGDGLNTTVSDSSTEKAIQDQKELAQAATQSTNTVVQGEERKQQAFRETANESKRLSDGAETLHKDLNFNDASIDSMKQSFQELGIAIDSVSVNLKNGALDSFTIKGTDGIERTVSATKKLDDNITKVVQSFAKANSQADKIEFKIDTGKFSAQITKVTSDFNNLSIKSNEIETDIQQLNQEFNNMQVASAANDVNALIKAYIEYERILESVNNKLDIHKTKQQEANRQQKQNNNDVSLTEAKKALSWEIDNYLKNNTAAAKQFADEIRKIRAAIDTCDDSAALKNLKAQFQNVKAEANVTLKSTQTLGDKIKKQWQQYSTYLGVASIFQWAEQGLRSMFEQVKLIDSAMTELKKVTNETDEAYNKFLTNAADRSREIGTTIDGLVESTANFARLGYGFEDAQGLAEVANIYAVVGDEIEGVEGATESLISTMAAFKNEMNGMSNTDFAMSIIDKFNEIGKLIA